MRLILYGVLVLAVMGLIFFFSSHEADRSQSLSDGLLYDFLCLVGRGDTEITETLGKLIRKIAHFTEYFALGLSAGLFFHELESQYGRLKLSAPWLSFALSSIYSATDEFHQYFVPGRSMQLSDVLLDSLGAAAGLAFLLLLRKYISIHREERKRRE